MSPLKDAKAAEATAADAKPEPWATIQKECNGLAGWTRSDRSRVEGRSVLRVRPKFRRGRPAERALAVKRLLTDPRLADADVSHRHAALVGLVNADGEGMLTRKQATWAQETGIGLRKMNTVARNLEKWGIVHVDEFLRPARGGQGANVYWFDPAIVFGAVTDSDLDKAEDERDNGVVEDERPHFYGPPPSDEARAEVEAEWIRVGLDLRELPW
jgi:hypothetical protein